MKIRDTYNRSYSYWILDTRYWILVSSFHIYRHRRVHNSIFETLNTKLNPKFPLCGIPLNKFNLCVGNPKSKTVLSTGHVDNS